MKKTFTIWRQVRKNSTTTIEVVQWLPAIAFLALLVWYLATPSKIGAMAAAGLLAIVAIAFGWAMQMAKHVSGSRRLQYSALQVGDELEEEIILKNRSFLPVLWAEFVDQSNIPDYYVSSVRAADGQSQVRWHAETICSRRGVFLLGPWELRLGDPLGIFRVRQQYHQRQEVLIYPPLADLPPHLLPYIGVQGDERPLHMPVRAETINAFSARPYIAGDPLRHLHWRTTARKDQPFVKLFDPEAATSVWLVADCDVGQHCGEGQDSSFETMILILASLSAQMLRDNLAVGLFADAAQQVIIRPERGQPHLWEILKALAPLEPVGSRPLAISLRKLQQISSPRNMTVVVTPRLDLDWLPELSRLSGLTGAHHAQAILLDRESFGGVGKSQPLLPFLAGAGVHGQVIERGQVKPNRESYGEARRWDFQSLATGRVVARHTPRVVEPPHLGSYNSEERL